MIQGKELHHVKLDKNCYLFVMLPILNLSNVIYSGDISMEISQFLKIPNFNGDGSAVLWPCFPFKRVLDLIINNCDSLQNL